MTVLRYKGFRGRATYEDGELLIELLHISDLITASCDSAAKVTEVFEELVDDYVETCKCIGKEPEKPFKGSLNIRMSPDLHKKIAMLSVDQEVTLNSWIVGAIEQKIAVEEYSVVQVVEYANAKAAQVSVDSSDKFIQEIPRFARSEEIVDRMEILKRVNQVKRFAQDG